MKVLKKHLIYLYVIFFFNLIDVLFYLIEGADSFGWTTLTIIFAVELVVWAITLVISYYRNRQTLGEQK